MGRVCRWLGANETEPTAGRQAPERKIGVCFFGTRVLCGWGVGRAVAPLHTAQRT